MVAGWLVSIFNLNRGTARNSANVRNGTPSFVRNFIYLRCTGGAHTHTRAQSTTTHGIGGNVWARDRDLILSSCRIYFAFYLVQNEHTSNRTLLNWRETEHDSTWVHMWRFYSFFFFLCRLRLCLARCIASAGHSKNYLRLTSNVQTGKGAHKATRPFCPPEQHVIKP